MSVRCAYTDVLVTGMEATSLSYSPDHITACVFNACSRNAFQSCHQKESCRSIGGSENRHIQYYQSSLYFVAAVSRVHLQGIFMLDVYISNYVKLSKC